MIMYTIHKWSNDRLMRHNGSLLNIHTLTLLLYFYGTIFQMKVILAFKSTKFWTTILCSEVDL